MKRAPFTPMPDELPPNPADDDASKAETIRITLPPKSDQPTTVKRETVRINLPGKPAPTVPPFGGSPKKETTKIVTSFAETAPVPAAPKETARIAVPGAPPPPAPVAPPPPVTPPLPPPSGVRPFVPPPPRPPSQAGMPLPPAKPLSGVQAPPKPPSLSGARPTVPLKPAPSPSGVAPKAPLPMGSGVQAAPKKETARITLPAEGATTPGKPAMPKATVKMQQTQPLISKPAPALRQSSAMTPAPSTSTSPAMQVEASPDGVVNVLAIVALVISLISLGLAFWAYKATELVSSSL